MTQFKFGYEERVRLKEPAPALGLAAGAIGIVCAFYAGQPPGYEVDFSDESGINFSMIVLETELDEFAED